MIPGNATGQRGSEDRRVTPAAVLHSMAVPEHIRHPGVLRRGKHHRFPDGPVKMETVKFSESGVGILYNYPREE
jgi:hypothetical protein